MSMNTFVICFCAFTLLAYLGLMFMRGWLINECRREQRKMRVEWDDWQNDRKEEQEKWIKDFEDRHPMWSLPQKRTA